jgi:hypothetical protein
MVLTPVGIFKAGVHSLRYTLAGNTADDGSDGRACDGADGSSDSSYRGAGYSATGDRADSSSYEM